ncbi:MAG: DUF5317 domain-containing protein [Anaerolineae bacterium]
MILLACLALALLLSWALGGRFVNLAKVSLRWSGLVLVSLALQVFIFSAFGQRLVADTFWSGALYALSLALIMVACWVNRRVSGIALLGLGLVLNAVVIYANFGRMPASLAALRMAGIVESEAAFYAARVTNSVLIGDTTPLWFLGDVMAVPAVVPLANVFSAGDVLIVAGGSWFVFANMRTPRGHPSVAVG